MQHGFFKFDVDALAQGWGISRDEAMVMHRDARLSSEAVTWHLCRLVGGKLARRNQKNYDFTNSDGFWEARCIANSGLHFTQAGQRGKKRVFDEQEFLELLGMLAGYAIADIRTFPSVEYWFVDVEIVRRLYAAGQIPNGSMGYEKARKFLASLWRQPSLTGTMFLEI